MTIQDAEPSFPVTSPQALLQSFEDEEDIIEWINNAIDNNQGTGTDEAGYDLAELEKCVSQLSSSLELVCEDTSTHLERTIEEISRTVPRLSYDFQFMRENVLSLQGTLHAVEAQSKSTVGSHETLAVLDRLHYLDIVKRNMVDSLAVLKEAEAWSSLETEVMTSLSEHEYSRAAARLSEASKSLGVFQNTPEYDNRKNLLVSLQNQLEASLSSALVAGISSGDVELCKKYFDIFCHIDRESEFRSYWNGSKRKTILSNWEGASLSDCNEKATVDQVPIDTKFSEFLKSFFNELLLLADAERVAIAQVFPDPQVTLSTFLATTLSSLHPTPSQRLASLVGKYDDLALQELIAAYKVTEEFALSIQKIMEKLRFSERSPAQKTLPLDDSEAPAQLQRSHSRRRSQRLSFSRRLGPKSMSVSGIGAFTSNTMDNSWGEALFEPFVDFQCDYSRLERKFLKEQLRRTTPTGNSSSQSARLLRERTVDLFSLLEDAVQRCVSFTHGFGAVGLLQAIEETVTDFLRSAGEVLLNSSNNTQVDYSDAAFGDDLAELDYSAEEFNSFQSKLHLLEVIRSISERLTVFVTKLHSQLVQIATTVKSMTSDSQGFYLTGTIKTAIDLLQTSVLNNVELQTLVINVDPDTTVSQVPSTPTFSTLFSIQKKVDDGEFPLIQGARVGISDITHTCQLQLQETILAPLIRQLNNYASSPSIVAEATGTVNDLPIPRFSLSPSYIIQRVAEGVLNLPRFFEVYAGDDALSFSISTLPHIDAGALQHYLDHPDIPEAHLDSSDGVNRSRARHLASPSLSSKVLSPKIAPKVLTPEAVSSAWLASLTMSLLSHFTSTVLPSIRFLNAGSVAQLTEDIGYLSQIVKALNVEWKPLAIWKESITLDEAEWRARLESAKRNREEQAYIVVLMNVGRMRGWPT